MDFFGKIYNDHIPNDISVIQNYFEIARSHSKKLLSLKCNQIDNE